MPEKIVAKDSSFIALPQLTCIRPLVRNKLESVRFENTSKTSVTIPPHAAISLNTQRGPYLSGMTFMPSLKESNYV